MPISLMLDGSSLTLDDVVHFARAPGSKLTLDADALRRLASSRVIIDQAISRGETMYGINTGFGKLANVRVDAGSLDQLQLNLIRALPGTNWSRNHSRCWANDSGNGSSRETGPRGTAGWLIAFCASCKSVRISALCSPTCTRSSGVSTPSGAL
jgi:hypothetical protein